MIMKYRVKLREEYWYILKRDCLKKNIPLYQMFEEISKKYFDEFKGKTLQPIKSFKSPKYVYLTDEFKEKFALYALDKNLSSIALADHIMETYIRDRKE